MPDEFNGIRKCVHVLRCGIAVFRVSWYSECNKVRFFSGYIYMFTFLPFWKKVFHMSWWNLNSKEYSFFDISALFIISLLWLKWDEVPCMCDRMLKPYRLCEGYVALAVILSQWHWL